MKKILILFLILICSIAKTSPNINSYSTIKLKDLTEREFSMSKDFIIFEYENKEPRIYNSSINFFFNKGGIFSTKLYIYDSLDKIQRDSSIDHKFINYLYETSLKNKKQIKISYDDDFYRDNCTFYLVLYDKLYGIYNKDTIYVVNSLKYLDFGDEITFTHSDSILFNFLIEKNFSTYLHYQTKLAGRNGTFYDISILDEEGEELINGRFNSLSGYIKIEPYVRYYAHINFLEDINFNSKTFSLNYEKYKNNILIQDENEIDRTVISAQNYTFFKSISNLTINESIILKCYFSGHFPEHEFYLKIYDSDDFESLVDSFPTDKTGFDYKLELEEKYSVFEYKFKKLNESQIALLFGVFVGEEYSLKREPKIYLRVYKPEPKSDEEDSDSGDVTDSTDNKNGLSLSIGWIIFIVVISVIIVGSVIAILIYLYHAKKRNNYQLKNDVNSSIINNENDVCYNKVESDEEKAYYE